MASGTSTAAFQLGGALGAAVVTTVVVARTAGGSPAALTAGMRADFLACAIFAGLALLLAVTLLRRPPAPAAAGAASAKHAATGPQDPR